jgi:MoxR-like ATPase
VTRFSAFRNAAGRVRGVCSRLAVFSQPLSLIGRDPLIDEVVREIRKGKHVVLTGPVGISKWRCCARR